MTTNKYNDPEWISEKMFGEEFDSLILYYVVKSNDNSVLFHGSLEECKQYQDQIHKDITISNYSDLTPEMRASLNH